MLSWPVCIKNFLASLRIAAAGAFTGIVLTLVHNPGTKNGGLRSGKIVHLKPCRIRCKFDRVLNSTA